VPAGADEVEEVNDQDGGLFDRLGLFGAGGQRLLPDDAFLAEEPEGDRVVAI
jgi:hypothetical protein